MDQADLELEWQAEVDKAVYDLSRGTLTLDGDSIAAYRGLIAKLDAAVFRGFHIIHRRTVAAISAQRTEPRKATVTIDDL